MIRKKLTVLLAIAVLGIGACASLFTVNKDSLQESSIEVASSFRMDPTLEPFIEAMSRTDFSSLIDRERSTIEAGIQGAPFSIEMDGLNPGDYTSRELKLICGRADAQGGRTSIGHLHILCYAFMKEHGVLPRSASELLAWSLRNSSAEGLRMSKLSIDQQFSEVDLFINPVTGKFYDTFQATVWQPGGINFKELHAPEEIDAAFMSAFDWEPGRGLKVANSPEVLSVWLIEVWGESPNRKLGSRPVTLMIPHHETINDVDSQVSTEEQHTH